MSIGGGYAHYPHVHVFLLGPLTLLSSIFGCYLHN